MVYYLRNPSCSEIVCMLFKYPNEIVCINPTKPELCSLLVVYYEIENDCRRSPREAASYVRYE
jgi:hypothetical protein